MTERTYTAKDMEAAVIRTLEFVSRECRGHPFMRAEYDAHNGDLRALFDAYFSALVADRVTVARIARGQA